MDHKGSEEYITRVRTCFGKFWRVVKVDNVIFREKFFQNGYGKFLILFGEFLKCPKRNIT